MTLLTKPHLKIFIFLLMVTLLGPVFASSKPFVVPEIKEWKSGNGDFTINQDTRIVYNANHDEVKAIANLLSQDIAQMFGFTPSVVRGKAKAGDIVLNLSSTKYRYEEEYKMVISNQLVITAPKNIGLLWATRTLLQLAEQDQKRSLQHGTVYDYPDYPVRGFMLDCGRKFVPMSYLNDLVKIMSYYKMNTLHIHLNDNGFKQHFEHDWQKTYSAFRLESDTYPGLAAYDGHYTKAEFREFQLNAKKYGVEIIPEIDVPAHSLCFVKYNPEIGSQKYGLDHLDLFSPKTYEFVDGLIDEYLGGDDPVFIGDRFNIGTDEYSNEDQKVVEQFRYFTNYYINKIESYGKQACLWGSLTHAKGETPVKADNVILSNWNNDFANPVEMIDLGYRLVSMHDWHIYIVPGAPYYFDYLDIENLYNNWTPNLIGKHLFAERHPSIIGGMFALWNDHVGNGISIKDIHHRIYPSLHTIATKTWSAHLKKPYSFNEFNTKRHFLSEAPGVNQLGRVGTPNSKVFTAEQMTQDSSTGITEIGYDYTVSFTLHPQQEEKGTYLFRSPNSVFYLSDPINGMMGYERDGYLNTFRYRVDKGKSVDVKIAGNASSVTLYINKELVDHMNIQKRFFNGGVDSTAYYRTLVFPLEKTGTFNSQISNVEVFNYYID